MKNKNTMRRKFLYKLTLKENGVVKPHKSGKIETVCIIECLTECTITTFKQKNKRIIYA